MDDLRSDPEYEIRWPSETLATELNRIIARGRAVRPSIEWLDEVETLLRQAFAPHIPQREFGEKWNQSPPRAELYGDEVAVPRHAGAILASRGHDEGRREADRRG